MKPMAKNNVRCIVPSDMTININNIMYNNIRALNIDTKRVELGKPLIPSLVPQDMHININDIMNN